MWLFTKRNWLSEIWYSVIWIDVVSVPSLPSFTTARISWGGTEICQCRTGRRDLRRNMSLDGIKTWGSFDTASWSILVLQNQGTSISSMFDRTWINDDQCMSSKKLCEKNVGLRQAPNHAALSAGGVSDHYELTVVLLAKPPLFVLSHTYQHENWWPMMRFSQKIDVNRHFKLATSKIGKRHILGHDMV